MAGHNCQVHIEVVLTHSVAFILSSFLFPVTNPASIRALRSASKIPIPGQDPIVENSLGYPVASGAVFIALY